MVLDDARIRRVLGAELGIRARVDEEENRGRVEVWSCDFLVDGGYAVVFWSAFD